MCELRFSVSLGVASWLDAGGPLHPYMAKRPLAVGHSRAAQKFETHFKSVMLIVDIHECQPMRLELE